MWIENKRGGLAGPARIGRVTFSKSGQSLSYNGTRFEKLTGGGFKSNYLNTQTYEHYWISGCRRDGMDALYATDVTIDEDVRKEYWTEIRGRRDQEHVTSFRAPGKY